MDATPQDPDCAVATLIGLVVGLHRLRDLFNRAADADLRHAAVCLSGPPAEERAFEFLADAIADSNHRTRFGSIVFPAFNFHPARDGLDAQAYHARWRSLSFFFGGDPPALDRFGDLAVTGVRFLDSFLDRVPCLPTHNLPRDVKLAPHLWARFVESAGLCHGGPLVEPQAGHAPLTGTTAVLPQPGLSCTVGDPALLDVLRRADEQNSDLIVSSQLYPASAAALDGFINCATVRLTAESEMAGCWERARQAQREADGTLTWPLRPLESLLSYVRRPDAQVPPPRGNPSPAVLSALAGTIPGFDPNKPDWGRVKRHLIRLGRLTPSACEDLTFYDIAETLVAVADQPQTTTVTDSISGDEVIALVAQQAATEPKLLRLKLFLDITPNATLRQIECATGIPKSSVNDLLRRHTWIGHPPRGKAASAASVDAEILSEMLGNGDRKLHQRF